jgi:hypothetical protein
VCGALAEGSSWLAAMVPASRSETTNQPARVVGLRFIGDCVGWAVTGVVS